MATITTIIRGLDTVRHDVEHWFAVHDTAEGRRIVREQQHVFSTLSQFMGGGNTPHLWSKQEQVTKLTHNDVQKRYWQAIMYLAAHERSGIVNLCPFATPQCIDACLGHTSGRLQGTTQQRAQVVRTHLLVQDPLAFAVLFLDDLRRFKARLQSADVPAMLAARPNGDSDVPWERVQWLLDLGTELGVDQWLDYTKWPRNRRKVADNYHLSHSITERNRPRDVRPGDVVVVGLKRSERMPDTWNGMPVVDGDYDHGDLRFLDPPGHVTLLRGKGTLYGKPGAVDSFVKPAVLS